MRHPKETYQKRIKQYQDQLHQLKTKSNRISNLRLLISLGGIISAIYSYVQDLHFIAACLLGISLILFFRLVFQHRKINLEKKYAAIMLKINEESLARLSGEWTSFPDTGNEFLEESHPYAVDLDIFGRRSLFQLINTTNTFIGRQKLKDLLLNFPTKASEIMDRQKAIGDLAAKLDWRQKFQSEGVISSDTGKNPDDLFKWANSPKDLWNTPWVISLVRLSPALTIILAALSIFFPRDVPYAFPLFFLFAHAVFLFHFRKETSGAFAIATKYQNHIKSFHKMLNLFEQQQFSSSYLHQLQKKLKNKNNQPAYVQIHRLEKTVEMMHVRYHQLYLFFDIITLWDFQCMVSLEKWKKQSGSRINEWLNTIGEIEALCSCALISFDHPDWAWPEIEKAEPKLKAVNLGHPLLPESRVCNNVEIKNPGEILLITGSNMSGKSTFLRTIGLNLALAFLGCPVCAQEFACSIMEIYTSMRINDNLDTGTSSFLAELLRIKRILEEAQKDKPIIFLLDEIFKGTNSRDRHTGAKHLIKKLSTTGAIGLVSTHDLELGDLAQENNSQIKNFHFEEYYQNGEIRFDYKLRPGISPTRNAIYLMKMAGIEIDEQDLRH